MIRLTTEQAQQIEEALAKIAFEAPSPVTVEALAAIAFDALPLIRAARSQELNLNCKSVQKRLATQWGYVKADQAEQEPVVIVDVLALAKELGHPCPEADAAFLEDLAKNIAAPLQAQIDRLMLEYCPVEMTPGQLTEPVNQEPVARPFECWSTNDGDSWFEHPADAQIIEDTLGSDAKVGDEFEVLAGWDSVRVTYRITAKSGNEDLADFEVECISHPHNDAAPVQQVDLTDYEIVRLYAESPMCDSEMIAFARAVIAADREKNK